MTGYHCSTICKSFFLFLQGQLWFNLDSAFSPIYIQILPLAASKDPLRRCVGMAQHHTRCAGMQQHACSSSEVFEPT